MRPRTWDHRVSPRWRKPWPDPTLGGGVGSRRRPGRDVDTGRCGMQHDPMDDVPDPVETALSERRARRQEQLRLDSSVDLLGRGRDAAERRLAVRAHLAAGTVIAGVAVAADRWTLTLESPAGAGPLRHTCTPAWFALRYAMVGARGRRPHPAGSRTPTMPHPCERGCPRCRPVVRRFNSGPATAATLSGSPRR